MLHHSGVDGRTRIYRWDLDKTYLRTEFDTVRDIVRTAIEPASEKRTVPGATTLMRHLGAFDPSETHILSGSPRQMRRKLEAKLRLDGIVWHSLTLKPSLGQLLRGRIRFLRDQVGYKLGALLESRVRTGADVLEVLFGDDAEADAFIYALYADLCAGRVDATTVESVLRRARVHPDEIPRIVDLARQVRAGDTVRRIFIHLDRGSPTDLFGPFGTRLCPFYNYFQPALVLLEDRLLEGCSALHVGVELLSSQMFGPDVLGVSFGDLVKRNAIGAGAGLAVLDAAKTDQGKDLVSTSQGLGLLVQTVERALPSLRELREELVAVPVDYVELFSADHARAKGARRRARNQRR